MDPLLAHATQARNSTASTVVVGVVWRIVVVCAGAAELAEVLAGMPHIAALAIEGGLLDVEGDWLRDTAGLIRHGR